ncbi:MAG: terminase family protein [Alphaproteobacteria bacterium]
MTTHYHPARRVSISALTGSIPKDAIVDVKMSRGTANAVDTVTVKHVSGGISSLGFKSYERGREKWQGDTLDFVWLDEEPPGAIYSEALARITATAGMTYITATPLLGMTNVIQRFLEDESPDRADIRMEIDEAEHIAPEERQKIIDGYLPHERDARTKGIPIMGSGRVFPVAEDAIEIGHHWGRIVGLDIGWDHPTAAVWLAHDRDTDIVHVYDAYVLREETPTIHAAAIKARGDWIPVAWPHDGLQHDKGSGDQISELYRKQGAKMLHEHAQFQGGGYGVEAGIFDMLDRMRSGRLKVARHLEPWWREFRGYHRKEGVIVKDRDDLMSATRYALMMLRFARSTAEDDISKRPIVYPPGSLDYIV